MDCTQARSYFSFDCFDSRPSVCQVHTIRNDKNKKRKEAHAQSLQEQAKRLAKKAESLQEYRKTEKKKRYRQEGKAAALAERKKQRTDH